MTQKERMLNALAQKPVDRVPISLVVTAVTKEIEDKANAYMPHAHSDAAEMAAIAEAIYDEFKVENFKIPFDMTIEAELMGCEINFGNDMLLPQVSKRQEISEDFLEKYKKLELKDRGRVKVVSDAIRILREHRGEDIPIAVSVVGPFSMLGMIFGFENLFMLRLEEPELLDRLLELTTDISARHANIQLEAGADIIQFGEAGASCAMVGPAFYEEVILPYHKKLVGLVKGPSVLHICGDNNRIIDALVSTGAAGLSVDERTDYDALYKASRGKTSIVGCVPSSLFLNGTADDIRNSAQWYADRGVDVLSNGCTLPLVTKTETVIGMSQIRLDSRE